MSDCLQKVCALKAASYSEDQGQDTMLLCRPEMFFTQTLSGLEYKFSVHSCFLLTLAIITGCKHNTLLETDLYHR